MGSSADEFSSLAEESVVSRQFSTRFIFKSILEYLDGTRSAVVQMTRHANSVRKGELP
jgi:hypothetical protein